MTTESSACDGREEPSDPERVEPVTATLSVRRDRHAG